MSGGSIGPLLQVDEGFNHQIVETFATVSQTDNAWTEKVCGMVAARDGSLQVGFGFGKYPNRNVVDGYGGVSQGVSQRNVRASRELSKDANSIDVGPLRYEIVEPLRRIRVRLAPNAIQPVSFDLVLDGLLPCVLEEREDRRSRSGFRRTADQIRYHQIGTASGWVDVEGVRHEVTPETWVMTRDHSWGIRPAVGAPVIDVAPDQSEASGMRVLAVWNPLLFRTPAGERYGFHQYTLLYEGAGFRHESLQGRFEFPDGRTEPVRDIRTKLEFDPGNHRLLSGEFTVTAASGTPHVLRARALQSGTGFHLGGGLYHGFEGRYHGQWRGPLVVEGEAFADCSTPESVARLGQFRDCLIDVRDSATGAVGFGNCQTYVLGAWPEMGLSGAR